jgi:hypothetical protein
LKYIFDTACFDIRTKQETVFEQARATEANHIDGGKLWK